jgi:hypothetical protein
LLGTYYRKNQGSLKFYMLTNMYSPNHNMTFDYDATLFISVDRVMLSL